MVKNGFYIQYFCFKWLKMCLKYININLLVKYDIIKEGECDE